MANKDDKIIDKEDIVPISIFVILKKYIISYFINITTIFTSTEINVSIAIVL